MNQEKTTKQLSDEACAIKYQTAIQSSAVGRLAGRAEWLDSLVEKLRTELAAEAARTAEEKLRADQMTEQHRMQCNIPGDLEKRAQQAEHVAHTLALDKIALEAQLSAIGAGGVESLRKSLPLAEAATKIANDTESALRRSVEILTKCERQQQITEPAPQGEKVYEELPEPAATGLGDEYESFDRDGRAMGKAYETILYFTADQMRSFADATADLRASQAKS